MPSTTCSTKSCSIVVLQTLIRIKICHEVAQAASQPYAVQARRPQILHCTFAQAWATRQPDTLIDCCRVQSGSGLVVARAELTGTCCKQCPSNRQTNNKPNTITQPDNQPRPIQPKQTSHPTTGQHPVLPSDPAALPAVNICKLQLSAVTASAQSSTAVSQNPKAQSTFHTPNFQA